MTLKYLHYILITAMAENKYVNKSYEILSYIFNTSELIFLHLGHTKSKDFKVVW